MTGLKSEAQSFAAGGERGIPIPPSCKKHVQSQDALLEILVLLSWLAQSNRELGVAGL
jgi:hypothetical protein